MNKKNHDTLLADINRDLKHGLYYTETYQLIEENGQMALKKVFSLNLPFYMKHVAKLLQGKTPGEHLTVREAAERLGIKNLPPKTQ